ncbi:Dabb family protein [Alicyclobacillus macrosporangiidus]|uniref:Dabb family protein n=1 Tax=Alicyclobacillus macrosporangiidus TaxID=392015 RepID=UPI000498158B|nr:Dabb family protein [Alicyclobacillus macrosporangiidus]
MFTHIVFFKLKDPRPETAERLRQQILDMQGKIPELKSIEAGVDVLHEARSYDLALIARFDSLADMQAYQVHPVHQALLSELKKEVAGSAAVDFES